MPVLQVLPTTTSCNIRALPSTPNKPLQSSNNNDDNNTTTTTSSIAIHTPETHLKKTVSNTDASNMHDEGAIASINEQDFPTVPSHAIHLTPLQRPVSERVQATNNNSTTSTITSNTTSTTNTTNSNTTSTTFTNNIHTSEAVLFNEYTPIVTAKPVTVNPNPLAIIRYLRLLVLFSPEPLSSFFARLEPTVHKWASALHFISLTLYILMEIILELVIEIWVILKPYKPELLLPSFAGLIMCFFGGSFVTLIAAAEAYRMVGYDSTKECLYSLIEDFQNVLQVAEQDAAVGNDDIEPSYEHNSSSNNSGGRKVNKEDEDGDIWSDWRVETESSKFDRPVSIHRPVAAYYSDGTEGLGEVHHAAAVSAQVYHIEDTPPTPCSRSRGNHRHTSTSSTTPATATVNSATPERNNTEAIPIDTTRPTSIRMATRSSLRRTSTDLPTTSAATATAVLTPAASSTQKKLRRRRSMFSPHSTELDTFRSTVLEHRTPIKQRASVVQSTLSTPPPTTTTSTREKNIDNLDSEIPSTNNTTTTTITSPTTTTTPNSTKKRTSIIPQSIDEYQRDQELNGADTIASRALFFLQNVDPNRFTNAIIGLNTGFVAVIATLKVQFAKTITLGASLSKIIEGPIKLILLPILTIILPPPYKKWNDIILTYLIKSFAISIAWTLKRIISSFHSSIRGGLMFSKNIIEYIHTMGIIQKYSFLNSNIQYFDKIIGYSIALLGLYFQLTYGFALPFPLNIILFPFTILEYILVWCVNNSHYIVGH